MPGGRPVRLRRFRWLVGAAALTTMAPLAVSSAAPAKAAPAVQQIVVVTVLPPGAVADGTTAAGLVATLNGPVRDFWQTQTGGAVDFTATAGAPGWLSTQSDCTTLLPYNEVAMGIGYVGGANKHLLLYIPPGTGAAALPSCSDEGGYRAGPSFVMTGDLLARSASAPALAHQIGHGLGFPDSGIQQFTPGDRGPVQFGTAAGQDPYDVMGSAPQLGALDSGEQLALGLLPAQQIQDVPYARGSYDLTLTALAGGAGTRLVRVATDQYGHGHALLEYRAPVGTDAWLGSAQNTLGVQSGVLLRGDGLYPTVSDASPSETTQWASDRQLALTTGTSTTIGPRITVTVRSMTASQAVVRVVVQEPDFPRDLDRNGMADLIVAGPDGVLYKYPAVGNGPWGPGAIGARVVIGHGWQTRDLITVAGGWQGTGAPEDVLARDRANGDLWMYPGNGSGGISAGHVIGHGWQVMTALFSPGDWDGDGNADLIARRNDGTLFLYPGNGAGGFGSTRKIGAGWNVMTAFAMTGSYTFRSPDFFAGSTDGTLWLYVGDGHGGFVGRRAVGHGWQSFRALTGVGDWNQDGNPDVLALTSTYDGALIVYFGYGNDAPMLMGWNEIGHAWNGYRVAS